VASKSLVEWLKILWENWRMSTWCAVCYLLFHVSCPPVSVSLRLGGSPPPLYRSRGRRITCAPRYLATWGSTTCYAVEWAAVWTILAAIWLS
jgi:hypothetical protein